MTKRLAPLILNPDGSQTRFERCSLQGVNGKVEYNEAFLDTLLFDNPHLLPLGSIDPNCGIPIPICTELSTEVGPLDILYVTPQGQIIIVENKLWRNPESRRKVVAQILDYASALANWSYEDLQREVSRRLGKKGNALFNIVKTHASDTEEASFVDSVSLCLEQGSFMLLICGDGIRQGTINIAEFLDRNTTLDFKFGLVEIGIFENEAGQRLILPQVLARTETIRRQIVQISKDMELKDITSDEELTGAHKDTPRQKQLRQFWSDLAKKMVFDDAAQSPHNATNRGFTTLRMPDSKSWIGQYLYQQRGDMGIQLTFNRVPWADDIYEDFLSKKEEIDKELPSGTEWSSENGKHIISFSRPILDLEKPDEYKAAIEWFSKYSNIFVNVFRPRIKAFGLEKK